MIDNVTILIITYNRYECLSRLLRFYYESGCFCQIIIADSSSNEMPDLPALRSLLAKENILHLTYPADTFVAEKIHRSLAYVQTEYSVMCADDDFILPSGIQASVSFLERNDDFVCAHGRYMVFSYRKNGGIKLLPLYLCARSITDDFPSERFKKLFSKKLYSGYPYYAVFRSTTHKKIWSSTNDSVDGWGLSEYVPCGLALIKGKMAKLKTLYGFRQGNVSGSVDFITSKRSYSEVRMQKAVNEFQHAFISTDYDSNADSAEKAFREFIGLQGQASNTILFQNIKSIVYSIWLRFVKWFWFMYPNPLSICLWINHKKYIPGAMSEEIAKSRGDYKNFI